MREPADPESKKVKRKIAPEQLPALAAALVMGALLGVLMMRGWHSAQQPVQKFLRLLWPAAAALPALGTQIVLHELGHLVFGLLSGYRLSFFRLGSWMLVHAEEKLTLRKLKIAGVAGQCLMIPPETSGSFPYLLYNLGGGIFNLLAAAGSGILLPLTGGNYYLHQFLLILCLTGIWLAATNLAPVFGANDGRNVADARRSALGTRSLRLQLLVAERLAGGERLRDMPPEWFVLPPEEEMGNGLVAALAVFSANRLLDRKEFPAAAERIEWLLSVRSAIAPLHRNLLLGDLVAAQLLAEGASERLSEWRSPGLQSFKKSMRTFPALLRTEYIAALLADGDREKARELQAAFEIAAARYPYPQEIEGERELMERAEQRIYGAR